MKYVGIVLACAVVIAVSAMVLQMRGEKTGAAPTGRDEATNTTPAESAHAAVASAVYDDAPSKKSVAQATPTPTTRPAGDAAMSATQALSVAASKADVAIEADPNTVVPLDFRMLSGFKYVDPATVWDFSGDGNPGKKKDSGDKPKTDYANQVPPKIKALTGRQVGISGYMMPLDFNAGMTRKFLLVATNPHCMYCQPPNVNEFIVVTMRDEKAVAYKAGVPVIVTGKMAVREDREDGIVTSLYHIDAEQTMESANEALKDQNF